MQWSIESDFYFLPCLKHFACIYYSRLSLLSCLGSEFVVSWIPLKYYLDSAFMFFALFHLNWNPIPCDVEGCSILTGILFQLRWNRSIS